MPKRKAKSKADWRRIIRADLREVDRYLNNAGNLVSMNELRDIADKTNDVNELIDDIIAYHRGDR